MSLQATYAEKSAGPVVKKTFTVSNRLGLHARPAALLINALRPFRSAVMVGTHENMVNAKSILGLLSLAARPGTRLTFNATGPDAAEALKAVEKIFASAEHEDARIAAASENLDLLRRRWW